MALAPGVVLVVNPPIDPDIAVTISSVVTCWLPAAVHGAEPRQISLQSRPGAPCCNLPETIVISSTVRVLPSLLLLVVIIIRLYCLIPESRLSLKSIQMLDRCSEFKE